jgi:hypothetical protein
MSVLDRARFDIKRFSKEISLTFFRIAGQNEKTVSGVASRHHLGIDLETGLNINSRQVYCSISESNLNTAGYITRDANGNVNLVNTFVKWADSTGITRTYKITECFPDDTLGYLTCILGQWQL